MVHFSLTRFVNRIGVVAVVGILWMVLCSTASAQPLPPKNQQISPATAQKYIANFKNSGAAAIIKVKGGALLRGVVDSILAQKGCVAIRMYYAQKDDGTFSMVCVGVNDAGNDMADGIIAEELIPCPPYCDATGKLTR